MLRNNVFDNAKLLMIFFVVFGHLIELIINQSETVKVIYKFIYSIHMPVFIILSGAVTKLDMSKNVILKNIRGLVIPFFVFSILYEFFHVLITGGVSYYTLNWQPYWILWFLFSMFIWRTTLPIVMKLKFPLLLSVMVSLLVGYVGDVGYFLGASRTLYFFPFFILGYKLGPNFLSNNFFSKIPKLLCFLVLLVNFIFFGVFKDLPHQWLYGSFSYYSLGDAELWSFTIRLILYFISVVSSLSVLMLIPNLGCMLAKKGENSLFVYLWHGFLIKVGIYFGIKNVLSDLPDTMAVVTLFISAVLITALLSSVFVKNFTNKFLLSPTQRFFLIRSLK